MCTRYELRSYYISVLIYNMYTLKNCVQAIWEYLRRVLTFKRELAVFTGIHGQNDDQGVLTAGRHCNKFPVSTRYLLYIPDRPRRVICPRWRVNKSSYVPWTRRVASLLMSGEEFSACWDDFLLSFSAATCDASSGAVCLMLLTARPVTSSHVHYASVPRRELMSASGPWYRPSKQNTERFYLAGPVHARSDGKNVITSPFKNPTWLFPFYVLPAWLIKDKIC